MPKPFVPLRDSGPVMAVEAVPVPSAFWNMAFACWLATIFILYSRFFDLVFSGFYIPRLVLSLMGGFFLLSGRPLFFARSPLGKIMIGLSLWVSVTLIFSVWKGGSLPVYEQFLQSLFFFAVCAGLPTAVSHVRKSYYTLAFSGVLAALMSFHWGMYASGRLALKGGSYADPNYFAMGLLAVVPFLWEMTTAAQSKFVRAFAGLGMLPAFLVIERTGSRGAMLAFAVMLLLWIIISPMKTRVILILLSTIGLGVVVATMPSYVRERYLTAFSGEAGPSEQAQDTGDPDQDRLKADVSSSAERKRLLQESIALTIEHPIVGVGPGCFQAAIFDEYRAKGIKHNSWMMTHNSYTQLSCETGFPGLILLVCLIVCSFNNLRVVLKGARPEGARPDPAAYASAKSLLLSLVAVCVCIFFLAVVYDFTVYVWAGLTVALRRVYEEGQGAVALNQAEPESVPDARPALLPAYAKARGAAPRHTPTVSGRPIRFNRFR